MLSNDTKATTLAITDTKLYLVVVTLLSQVNEKLLKQLKSGFKRTTNLYKYQPKVTMQRPNPFLDYLIGSGFQGVNSFYVLSFENTTEWTMHTKYYLPTVDIKYYNVMIDGQSFFDKPMKHDLRTYDNMCFTLLKKQKKLF